MPVTTVINRIEYSASAGQVSFAYPYRIFAAADLKVFKNEVLLSLTTHYSVTGVGAATGGNVVLVTGAAVNDKIWIVRQLQMDQQTDYIDNDPFPAQAHEDALDKLTMLAQQLKEITDRCLQLNLAKSFGLTGLELPAPTSITPLQGGRKALVWDIAEKNLALVELVTQTGLVGETIVASPFADFPTAGITGKQRVSTDKERGSWTDQASQWNQDYGQRVNLRSYGMHPNNSASANSTAFAAALAQFPTGDVIFDLPHGTYELNAVVAIAARTRVMLEGRGKGRTVLKMANASNLDRLIYITGTSAYLTLRGLTIDPNKVGQTSGINRGLEVNMAGATLDFLDIDDVEVLATREGQGFQFAGGLMKHLLIHHCRTTGVLSRSVNFEGGAKPEKLWILDNEFASVDDHIHIDLGREIFIARNHLTQSAASHPINLDSCFFGAITDNIVLGSKTGAPGDLISVGGILDPAGSSHFTIQGNVLTGGGDNGMTIGGNRMIIVGNVVQDMEINGIWVTNGSQCTVVGNLVRNVGRQLLANERNGIKISSNSASFPATDNFVAHNDIEDYQGVKTMEFGVSVQASGGGIVDRTAILGNRVRGATGGTNVSIGAGVGHTIEDFGPLVKSWFNGGDEALTFRLAAGRSANQDVNLTWANRLGVDLWNLFKNASGQFVLRDVANARNLLVATPGAASVATLESGVVIGAGGTITRRQMWFATNVSDGGIVTHGHGSTPLAVIAIGSVAGNIISVTAKGATTFTVAIKLHDGTAGSTQDVYWMTLG